jgi:hypothetical protein
MAGFGQGDYEERVTHLIAPTIAQLAKAISEKHWKPLHYQVRQGLRPFSASGGIVCARLALVLRCKILHTLAQPGCYSGLRRVDHVNPKCADFKAHSAST